VRSRVLTRVGKGDYLCANNDGTALWRFHSYDDGRAFGLEVAFEHRTFWAASWTYMPPGGKVYRDEIDELPWIEKYSHLSSRREAIEAVFGSDE
jgi:hypothetical protein